VRRYVVAAVAPGRQIFESFLRKYCLVNFSPIETGPEEPDQIKDVLDHMVHHDRVKASSARGQLFHISAFVASGVTLIPKTFIGVSRPS
jgi:hypothetical protein